jgi:GH24 family phage-related lysozyme (muramidase)
MPTLRQKLRQVEQAALRLTGDRRQAVGLRKKIERRLHQLAAGHAGTAGRQRVSASHEPQVYERFVRSGRAGWVNVPGKGTAVLVERGTGCTLVDSRGSLILRSRRMLPSKPAINPGVFLRHLKHTDVENYLPYMYRDREGNVTVGIGHLLPTASDAKNLNFFTRGPNVGAMDLDIERAFNRVKNAPMPLNTVPTAFQRLTNIRISEAYAETLELDDMDEFQRILRSKGYFPEFETYPIAAKMAILDMAYTLGAKGLREGFPVFTSAVRRRNWKLAAQESHRKQPSAQRNQIVRDWLQQAAPKDLFFIHPTCTKELRQLVT